MFSLLPAALGLLTAFASADAVLPHPAGQYGVATSQAVLVDRSRKDPYAAEAGLHEDRKLVLSAFYPSSLYKDCVGYKLPYMPSATAAFYDNTYAAIGIPNNTFSSLSMEYCRETDSGSLADRDFPLALFSPGLGNPRLLYNAMAQSLASEGFVVITIDHPYDAEIVEFPNGSTILAASIETDEEVGFAVNVRVQDVISVFNHLESDSKWASNFLPGVSCGLNTSEAVMFGHSLGGATAVEAAFKDPRLAAAINLDGTMFGSVLSEGSKAPMMILAHDSKNLSTDASWSSVWNATKNTPKIALAISDTEHGSYTDFPLILDVVDGVSESLREQLIPLIGSLPGTTARRLVSKLVGQFFEFALGRSKSVMPRLTRSDSALVEVLAKHVKV